MLFFMLQLIGNHSTHLDLQDNTSIVLEYNNPLFAPLGELSKNYSYPFTLPVTSVNQAFFSFADSFHIPISTQEQILAVHYNGAKLAEGNIGITQVSNSAYETYLNVSRKLDWLNLPMHQFTPYADIQSYDWEYDIIDIWGYEVNNGFELIFFYQHAYLYSMINFVCNRNGWTAEFNWDARLNDLMMLNQQPLLDSEYSFPDMTVLEFFSELQLVFNLKIDFNYQSRTIAFSHVKDHQTQQKSYEFTGAYKKKVTKNEGYTFSWANPYEKDGEPEFYRPLYEPYTYGNGKIKKESSFMFLPRDENDNPYYPGGFDGFRPNPVVLFFNENSLAHYQHSSGLSLKWESLIPEFWTPWLDKISSKEIYTTKIYLDSIDLANLNMQDLVRINHRSFFLKKLRVKIPNQKVSKFVGEVELLGV